MLKISRFLVFVVWFSIRKGTTQNNKTFFFIKIYIFHIPRFGIIPVSKFVEQFKCRVRIPHIYKLSPHFCSLLTYRYHFLGRNTKNDKRCTLKSHILSDYKNSFISTTNGIHSICFNLDLYLFYILTEKVTGQMKVLCSAFGLIQYLRIRRSAYFRIKTHPHTHFASVISFYECGSRTCKVGQSQKSWNIMKGYERKFMKGNRVFWQDSYALHCF